MAPGHNSRSVTARRTSKSQKAVDSGDDTCRDAMHDDGDYAPERGPKRRKTAGSGHRKAGNAELHERLFGTEAGGSARPCPPPTCAPPTRQHGPDYHRPVLLDSTEGRASLLAWFDSVSTARAMPWRKAWLRPSTIRDASERRQALERRAYEVWISEIMLQQTRVAVVIDYWDRWMARWPTIQDLATAESEDVLAAWQGLGYYSRATRIHEAAKLVVADPELRGLLPADVRQLEARVPGVGRYTAGAISSIVFGRPAPMVDGNVLRVLSRQLGLFGNVKSEKAVIDTLWAAADALVRTIAGDVPRGEEDEDEAEAGEEDRLTSDRPGRWGQALMELGSTVCTPKPVCSQCPITSTCRVYAEGRLLASKKGLLAHKAEEGHNGAELEDIEDLCTLCEPFEELMTLEGWEEEEEEEGGSGHLFTNTASTKPTTKAVAKAKSKQQSTLAAFAFTRSAAAQGTKKAATGSPVADPPAAATEAIVNHARKFPIKAAKKDVREEHMVVCAVRRASDGRFLIRQRPPKGLLAGLWEFPSRVLLDNFITNAATSRTAYLPQTRQVYAEMYAANILQLEGKKNSSRPAKGGRKGPGAASGPRVAKHAGELGTVPWLFSHLRHTMYVHLFTVDDTKEGSVLSVREAVMETPYRWSDDVESESMGTGMRKCWALVRDAVE